MKALHTQLHNRGRRRHSRCRLRAQISFLFREFSLCLIPALLLILLFAGSLHQVDIDTSSDKAEELAGEGISVDDMVRRLGSQLQLSETEMSHLGETLESARAQLLRLKTASVATLDGDPADYLIQQQRILAESVQGTAEFLSCEQHQKLQAEIEILTRNWRL